MQRQLMAVTWAFVVGLAASPPAQADISVQARLADFGYGLIDLNPGDGIAPGIFIQNQTYSFNGSAGEDEPTSIKDPIRSLFFNSSGHFLHGSTVSKQAMAPKGSSVVMSLNGSVADHDLNVSMSGNAVNGRANKNFSSKFLMNADPAISLVMTLTPFTQVVWTGSLDLAAEQTLGRRWARIEESRVDAEFSIVSAVSSGLLDFQFASLSLDQGVVTRKSDHMDLSLSFSNLSSDPATAILRSRLNGYGNSFLPVPEVGSSTLMLCGLGLMVGLTTVRRRAGSAALPQRAVCASLTHRRSGE